MVMETLRQIKTSIIFLLIFSLLTGLIYPGIITAIAQLFFAYEANGSLIAHHDEIIGSALIGQQIDAPNYFWGRPSATSPFPYNAANSSGSNMCRSNPDFLATVQKRVSHLRQYDINNQDLIPIDLVTASASGLDPEISLFAAYYQVPRIAKIRHLSEQAIENLIRQLIKKRTLDILGEPRINVLELNMALDQLRSENDQTTP